MVRPLSVNQQKSQPVLSFSQVVDEWTAQVRARAGKGHPKTFLLT